MLTALLIDGTRWMIVFPALMLFIAVWLGQAIDAQRRAIELGARPGGEMQVTIVLPVLVGLVSAFWLVGGDNGSAASTLRDYVAAWRGGGAQHAVGLFHQSPGADALGATWAAHDALLAERVENAARTFGSGSGIDPARPFNSLRMLEQDSSSSAERVIVDVEIVRRQRVETLLLGIIPTASQQTVVVERLGTITLISVPDEAPDWWPDSRPLGRVWRIESVALGNS